MRYQPACLEIDQKAHIVLLRDISRSGAGFESDLQVKVGEPLKYRWGNSEYTAGQVSWIENGRFGVENLAGLTSRNQKTKFGYRSVRVPLQADTTVYVDGRPHDAFLHNFGQRGLSLELANDLRAGAMMSVKMGKMVLDAVTVKWCEGNRVGATLRQALRIGEMAQIARECDASA